MRMAKGSVYQHEKVTLGKSIGDTLNAMKQAVDSVHQSDDLRNHLARLDAAVAEAARRRSEGI